MTSKENLSFEEAYAHLEKILVAMNGGKISLEESLNLFEKAEKLVRYCQTLLKQAEEKIDAIVKGQNGETELDWDQKPKLAPFQNCEEK
jgi:exodeoxyribonuclease VII small subunit